MNCTTTNIANYQQQQQHQQQQQQQHQQQRQQQQQESSSRATELRVTSTAPRGVRLLQPQQQQQQQQRKPRTCWSPAAEKELEQAIAAIESRGDKPTGKKISAEFNKPGSYPNALAAGFTSQQIQNKLFSVRSKRNRPDGSSSDEEAGNQHQSKRGKHENSGTNAIVTTDPAAAPCKLEVRTGDAQDLSSVLQKSFQEWHRRDEELLKTVQDHFDAAAAKHQSDLQKQKLDYTQAFQRLRAENTFRVEREQAARNQLQAEKDQLQAEKDQLQAEKDQLQAERDQLRAEKERLQTLHQGQLKAARESARNQLQKWVSELVAKKEDDDSPN